MIGAMDSVEMFSPEAVFRVLGEAFFRPTCDEVARKVAEATARGARWWAVVEGDTPVSLLALSSDDPATILWVGTDPDRRRQGWAGSLVRAAGTHRDLTAETDDSAVGFYRTLGFAVEPVTREYPGESVTRWRCFRRANP